MSNPTRPFLQLLILCFLLLAAQAPAPAVRAQPGSPAETVPPVPAPAAPEIALPLLPGFQRLPPVAVEAPFESGVDPHLAEAAVRLAAVKWGLEPESVEVVHAATTSLPLLGVSVASFKLAVGEAGGEPGELLALSLDAAGREVDLAALEAEEEKARAARYGRLDAALAEHLESVPADEPVPVAIWLAEPPYERPERPEPRDDWSAEEVDAVYRRVDAARGAFLEPLVEPVLARLEALGGAATVVPLAPLIHAELPPARLREVATWEEVDRVYLARTYRPALYTAHKTVHADLVQRQGRSGIAVRIAQIEVGGRVTTGNPYLSGIVQDSRFVCSSAGAQGGHATHVAGVLKSHHPDDRGIAPGATLWAGGSCSGAGAEVANRGATAASWGARVLNLSLGADTGRAIEGLARFYDDLVVSRFRTVVAAAGNSGWCFILCGSANVESPGVGYNVIAVGGQDDHNSERRNDDTIYGSSSWRDPLSARGDREKPELVAPAVGLNGTLVAPPWIGGIGSGTSYASPIVAGGAALLIQAQRSLATWPESIRAILLATAVVNVEGTDVWSEKDGAGGIDLWEADRVAYRLKGNWGGTSYRCASSPRRLRLQTVVLRAGEHTRAAAAWSVNPAAAGYPARPSADLDLEVIGPSGTVVARSATFDNNYEIVDFYPGQRGTYSIDLVRFGCTADPPYLGWAWWQDR